jgi:CheY-like chemotaxis protein
MNQERPEGLTDSEENEHRSHSPKVHYIELGSDGGHMHEDASGVVKRANTSLLVVDDDPSQLQYYASILRRAGYRVFAVGSGLEALTLLEKTYIDVVICDIRMPDVDGLELLKKLRAVRTFPQNSRIPIILFTAGGPELQIAATSLGVDGFCYKEEHPKRLVEQVESLISC